MRTTFRTLAERISAEAAAVMLSRQTHHTTAEAALQIGIMPFSGVSTLTRAVVSRVVSRLTDFAHSQLT